MTKTGSDHSAKPSAATVNAGRTDPGLERRRSTADFQIQELIRVGQALSYERDSGALLEMIVDAARRLTGADAGTLYVMDKATQSLHFKILQNQTLGIRVNAVHDKGVNIPPPVPLFIEGAPNAANVSSSVALNGRPVSIPDVYSAEGFNFSGVKAYDASSGYRSKSMLVVPLRDHNYDIIGVLQLLNAVDPRTGETMAFSEHDAALVSSLASQAAVAMTQKSLIDQLSRAYVDAERSNAELKEALKAVSTVRKIWIGFAFCLLAVAGAVYYLRSENSLVQLLKAAPSSPDRVASLPTGNAPVAVVSVEKRPMKTSIALTGQIEPIVQVNVVSPFSGKVEKKSFEFGQMVKAGEVLLTLDTTEIQMQLRDLTANFIKEQERFNEIKNWETGREVSQARAMVTKATVSLAAAKRKLDETKVLFDKGIVSRLDLEGVVEAYENQELALRSAEEDLRTTLKRGDANALKVQEMTLQNIKIRLDELRKKIAMAEIRSPADGIVIMPINNEKARGGIEAGSAVEQGAVLFIVGNLDGFKVLSNVEENNIGKLQLGQVVSITEDAYPEISFSGKISHISSQAMGGGNFGQRATFQVVTTVEQVPPENKNLVRVGLSATLQVTAYDKPDALVVPLGAVVSLDGETFVMLRDPSSGGFSKKEIQTGITTFDVVEVVDGLSLGDQVAANPTLLERW